MEKQIKVEKENFYLVWFGFLNFLGWWIDFLMLQEFLLGIYR
jgi:hypothetical protein